MGARSPPMASSRTTCDAIQEKSHINATFAKRALPGLVFLQYTEDDTLVKKITNVMFAVKSSTTQEICEYIVKYTTNKETNKSSKTLERRDPDLGD